MHITNISELRKAYRQGRYAWPGGYPLYFLCDDGESLCVDCAKKERRNIIESVASKHNDGWRVVALDINYEDDDCYCAHCNDKIESAYNNVNFDTIRPGE